MRLDVIRRNAASNWLRRSASRTYLYELCLPDFQGADPDQVQGALGRLATGLIVSHVRLLSYVLPLSAERFELALRAQKAQQRTPLGHDYREEEARSMRAALQTDAWSMKHYLVSWSQPLLALQGYARPSMPPLPLKNGYRERPDYLEPVDPAGHYLKVIGSYAFKPGVWTWVEPWAALVTAADGPMALCLDAVRIPDSRVRLARQGLRNMLRAAADDDDARELAQVAQEALRQREAFYQLRLLVLLRDAEPDRLIQRAKRLQQLFESALSISLLPGQQGGALDFFTGEESARMPGPGAHHTVLGSALPVAFGGVAGLVNQPQPRGVYLGFRIGMGAQSLGPLYLDAWHNERGEMRNQAYHMGFLGTTGSGKTVAMQAMLARERAIHDADIVLIEPLGNARKLADLLARDPKQRFYQVTWDNVQINPLEFVGRTDGEQEDHFVGLVETMLRRALDNIERGVLMEAFRNVYAGRDREAMVDHPECVPRLADLCEALERLARETPHELRRDRAEYVVREIDGLYVSGGYSRIFNAPTNLDLSFDGAIMYDLLGVAGGNLRENVFLTIFYYLMLGGLMRTARRRREQGQARPGIIALDEWFILSQNPYLAKVVVELIKTARNLRIALWLAEQDLATFAGYESAKAVDSGSLTGHHLLNNMQYWLAFRQQSSDEARLLRRQFPQKCSESYLKFLAEAAPGECIGLLDRSYLLKFLLLRSEELTLIPPDQQGDTINGKHE